jgi:hypothetical protein
MSWRRALVSIEGRETQFGPLPRWRTVHQGGGGRSITAVVPLSAPLPGPIAEHVPTARSVRHPTAGRSHSKVATAPSAPGKRALSVLTCPAVFLVRTWRTFSVRRQEAGSVSAGALPQTPRRLLAIWSPRLRRAGLRGAVPRSGTRNPTRPGFPWQGCPPAARCAGLAGAPPGLVCPERPERSSPRRLGGHAGHPAARPCTSWAAR